MANTGVTSIAISLYCLFAALVAMFRLRKIINCFSPDGLRWSVAGIGVSAGFSISGRMRRYILCHSCGVTLRSSVICPLLSSAFSSMIFNTTSGLTLPHVGHVDESASA